MKGNMKGKKKR